MLPDNALSTTPVPSAFVETVGQRSVPLVDYELGGRALLDASGGLGVQLWKVEVIGDDVWLSAPSVPRFVYFSRPNITEVALAFDQNMHAFVAFVQGGVAWLYWFDTSAGGLVFTSFPGAVTPRLTTDEKRTNQLANSDVILAYVRDNGLYLRAQRDRFLVEYLLQSSVGATLVAVARNRGYRLQFQLFPN